MNVDKALEKMKMRGCVRLQAEPQLWANIQQNPSTVFEAATTVMALITEVGECIDRSAMLMAAFDALLIPMVGVGVIWDPGGLVPHMSILSARLPELWALK